MSNTLFLRIIIVVISFNIIYSLIAIFLFRDKRERSFIHGRLNFEKISKRRKLLTSYIICFISSVLPYRVREIFILMLHVILHSLKTKILLIINLLSSVLEHILLFIIYFVGLPLTMCLQKIMEKEKPFIAGYDDESDILRRY